MQLDKKQVRGTPIQTGWTGRNTLWVQLDKKKEIETMKKNVLGKGRNTLWVQLDKKLRPNHTILSGLTKKSRNTLWVQLDKKVLTSPKWIGWKNMRSQYSMSAIR